MIKNYSSLLHELRDNFKLDLQGIHGELHWMRVAFNGYILHRHHPEIDIDVVQMFGLIHDSQRNTDSSDDELHGPRASEWVLANRSKLFTMSDTQVMKLAEACHGHTSTIFSSDITIQGCWDADRLDIGRCKPYIDVSFLGTPGAKDSNVMAHAMMRSRTHHNA